VAGEGGSVRGILVIPVVLVVLGLHAALDEDAGIRRWLHLRAELEESHARIAQLGDEVERLRDDTARLEQDRFAIESAIREELGLASAGQQVVRLRPRGLSSP